jgi:pimeloyl-ACP methyl ester carboxylesterase
MTARRRALRFVVMFVLAATASAAHATEADDAVARDEPYTQAQQLVDVDHGRRLNLYCVGTGSPTVVFDAGLGGSSSTWDLVQPAIALKTRACSYDRAGLGFSDPDTRPGTSANIVDDLHRLLTAASIKPPYILVGHSSGGMTVRLYADRYPEDVVGMVLVDPSHEDQGDREWQLEGQAAKDKWEQFYKQSLETKRKCIAVASSPAGLVQGTEMYKRCMPEPVAHFSTALNAVMLAHSATPTSQQAVLSELENVYYASSDQVRAARRRYGDMPLIVLTHAPFPKAPDETQAQRDLRTKLWETLHDELAALSSRGVNRTVPGTGHFIQWDKPQVVVDQILKVLAESRGQVPAVGTAEDGH